MASAKQIKANRENAKKTRGPVTAAGKYWSSKNAVKHGLRAAEPGLTVGENREEFEAFIEQGVHHYKPFDFYSHEIFDRLMHKLWKLKMIPKIESGIFAYESQTYEADKEKAKMVSEIKHPDFKEQDQKKTSYQNLLFGVSFLKDSNAGNAMIKLSSYETKLFNKFFQLEKIYYDYRDKVRGKRN